MKRLLGILVILLSGAALAGAVDYNALWQKGNAFYQQKQYDSAAVYYSQLSAQKPRNAVVYYNLGNTYYRLNKVALAVLNYERALKINPDYRPAKENLTLTRERISNKIHESEPIFFVRWWQSVTKPALATVWAISALVVFVLLHVLLFLRRFGRRYVGHIPFQVMFILVFVLCILLLFSIISAQKSHRQTTAVVMEKDAPLMSNGLKGKPLLLIPEGTTVDIRDERDGWLEISLPDGRTGWVRPELVTKI